MTPATIIREAQADGVKLMLSAAGTIKAMGDGAAVNRWLAAIREHKAEIVEALKIGAANRATASRWWLIHYPERDPVEVVCSPIATRAEILNWHPDAIAAEPFEQILRRPKVPMTADEEKALRSWLTLIKETDAGVITDVLRQCRLDADARDYFTRRAAAELPKPYDSTREWRDGLFAEARMCSRAKDLNSLNCPAIYGRLDAISRSVALAFPR